MRKIFIACMLLAGMKGFSQNNTAKSPLTISGYLEGYYTYDFGKPANHSRPSFTYSHNRHHEINLNTGVIRADYEEDNVRAHLALAAGTYMNANYAAEPGVLKNTYEANAGVKISKKKELWIDAGVMPSHIGFESAIGKDCWTLTRSILADNSPYFETGVKISYTSKNNKWLFSGLVLNGWQRIQRVDGNNTPAWGHQITFKPSKRITLNSSSFIGNDKPDSAKQMRYFHNFYGILQLSDHFGLTGGFDIGAEQKSKGLNDYNYWYSPVLILRISPDTKNNIAARAEYYSDAAGVIIATGTPDGFKTWGYSLNYDHLVRSNVMWRVEGRGFSAKNAIFLKNEQSVKHNLFLTTSLAISF